MTRAYTIHERGTRHQIEPGRALAAAKLGDVVMLPNALEEAGYLSIITRLFLDEVATLTSPATGRAVRTGGLTRLHDHLDPHQVATLLIRLDRRTAPMAVPVARALVEAILPDQRAPFFICSRLWVRAQVPYRLLEDHPDLLAAEHLVGHLLPAGPHRDFWLTHPRGTLSIWGALAPVRSGNTIALIPDDGSREGTYGVDGRPALRAEELPASTIAPALDPGDVLVFNADRLHGSVRNETDETRVSITSRVVMGRRLRFGPGPHWRPYHDARLLGTPFERLATVQSRLTPAALRRWRATRRWERTQRRS
jgi:hypothetical protein